MSRETAEAVIERDRSCRAWSMGFGLDVPCGGIRPIVIHHKILRGMGGTSRPEIHEAGNLVVLCDRHHDLAHSNPAAATACGVIIKKGNGEYGYENL